jgi:antitoxin CptB
MTGTTRSSDGLDEQRRRILFRSWHRGLREMDLIMGSFADATIDKLTSAELDQFERLMQAPDPELYRWISGEAEPPPHHDCPVFRQIREFHRRAGPIGGRA